MRKCHTGVNVIQMNHVYVIPIAIIRYFYPLFRYFSMATLYKSNIQGCSRKKWMNKQKQGTITTLLRRTAQTQKKPPAFLIG